MIVEQKLETTTQEALRKLEELSTSKFAERAAYHDETKTFPRENFKDLHALGLNAPTISKEYGGLGLGHHKGDVKTLWQMTTAVAMGDMSTARCWEGHNNALLLLDNIATEAQKTRWFNGVVKEGHIWSAWSGEPQAKTPGQKKSFGTHVIATDDGYLINGSKVFCSSATGATHAILLVNLEGPGGARHSTSGKESVIMLGCDLSHPGITYDNSWWNPMGMGGSVSYMVEFENVFIPATDQIGYAGQFLLEEWQTRFTPQYAATFLGGAKAAFAYTKKYVHTQNKADDPYIQHRLGRMAINIKTAEFWLERVAACWEKEQIDEAKSLGIMARYTVEQLATQTLEHALHACGARAMVNSTPLERIYRDLSFYVRHDNDDQLLATVGKSVLGENHDRSFFNANDKTEQK